MELIFGNLRLIPDRIQREDRFLTGLAHERQDYHLERTALENILSIGDVTSHFAFAYGMKPSEFPSGMFGRVKLLETLARLFQEIWEPHLTT